MAAAPQDLIEDSRQIRHYLAVDPEGEALAAAYHNQVLQPVLGNIPEEHPASPLNHKFAELKANVMLLQRLLKRDETYAGKIAPHDYALLGALQLLGSSERHFQAYWQNVQTGQHTNLASNVRNARDFYQAARDQLDLVLEARPQIAMADDSSKMQLNSFMEQMLYPHLVKLTVETQRAFDALVLALEVPVEVGDKASIHSGFRTESTEMVNQVEAAVKDRTSNVYRIGGGSDQKGRG